MRASSSGFEGTGAAPGARAGASCARRHRRRIHDAASIRAWSKAKVHPDHHAQVARSLYSLPTRFIGKTLDVRVDRASVRFYLDREMVKLHARIAPGKRSTDADDYPVGKADYALRSIDKLKERAREHGENIGLFAERLLGGPLPWGRMRQAYGLLRLCGRYGAEGGDADWRPR